MPWRNDPDKRRRDSRVYGASWRRVRVACLRRANWRCEIRLAPDCTCKDPACRRFHGCIGAASQVDHVDGVENDPDHKHLRAACDPCHKKVTAQQGGGYRSQDRAAPDPEPRPRTAW
jgi:5-methylcytosine-specific restriction endonuclease McrA